MIALYSLVLSSFFLTINENVRPTIKIMSWLVCLMYCIVWPDWVSVITFLKELLDSYYNFILTKTSDPILSTAILIATLFIVIIPVTFLAFRLLKKLD